MHAFVVKKYYAPVINTHFYLYIRYLNQIFTLYKIKKIKS